MKKLFLSICLMIVSVFAFAQWTWQNPLPTGNDLQSVYFTDENTGCAVGQNGTILKTTDGGKTWTTISSGTTNGLTSVCFTDANTGYAVGGAGTILKTTDGGSNWIPLSSGSSKSLKSVNFPDANTGYVVGDSGTILKTCDGGINWTALYSGTTYPLKSACFIDINTGYVVGGINDLGGTIMKTINGGATWSDLSIQLADSLYLWEYGPGDFSSVYFTDANTGYVASRRHFINILIKTTDGGITWNKLPLDFEISSICFTDSNTGYLTGSQNYGDSSPIGHPETIFLKTSDGGRTWAEQPSGTSNEFSSAIFIDANIGYAVGGSGAINKTINGGLSWTDLSSRLIADILISVFFPDKNTGYAMGSKYGHKPEPAVGIIFKTINGGTTWTALSSGTTHWLSSAYFTDANKGYVVGDGGRILKTIDGGLTWTVLSYGVNYDLWSVFFVDENTGYAVGVAGTILKTTDGGSNWSSLPSGTTDQLYSVFFTDAITGYVVGGNAGGDIGTILKTTNGGTTWSVSWSISPCSLRSVYFTNANTGYAVGETGYPAYIATILKTVDSGETWTLVSIDKAKYLSSIYFTDENTGYAVGGDYRGSIGIILKTIDAGTNWSFLWSGTSKALKSVYFTDPTTGYVVGDGGVILKTTNGGGFVSINEPIPAESIFTLYPNPASNKITISTNKMLPGKTNVSIISISGQQLMQSRFQNQKQFEMDVSTLAKGIYLVKIQADMGIETKKFVIQ